MPTVNRKSLQPPLLLLTAFLGLPLIAQQPGAKQGTDIVWTWSAQCNTNQQLRVAVRLGSKLLYEGLLPICRGNRDAENGRADFYFSSDRVFGGEYRARRPDSIECDIWQAGGEKDALVLGISLATKKQVMLNTLHIASPDKKTSTELDNGLYITTTSVITRYPLIEPAMNGHARKTAFWETVPPSFPPAAKFAAKTGNIPKSSKCVFCW